LHLVVLPDSESAEYCSSDLYNIVEGDCVFFLPVSGKGVERSNYKSSLGVQRTSAIGKIMAHSPGERLFIVTYPEALEERISSSSVSSGPLLVFEQGKEIPFERVRTVLSEAGFEKADFVSAPGQYAIRGSIIDIFSYSYNLPYRISFFDDEIESISTFDCNTQLSSEKIEKAEIYEDIGENCSGEEGMDLMDIFNEDTLVWLDSSDMYRKKEFFNKTERFKRVFLEVPVMARDEVEPVRFDISPQPVFNKNFELLCADIKSRMENSYKVYIFGEKQSQVERVKSILIQSGCPIPEFVGGKNIHNGFIDNEEKICCYTDHEIFDRFHRVRLRRTVDKSEQLTLNELSSFNIGDYIVHIDHGVGIFGGLVKLTDDLGRQREVVKLMYKDGDVVFVSVHSLNKISRFRSKDGEPPRIYKL
jgi:transcription-repair coupling factor (superfamily II helicase)